MKFKKVLLVCPPFYNARNRLAHFPVVGLGYIAEALKVAGIHVNVFDMNLGYSLRDLKNQISYFQPDLIGFTAMTLSYKKFYYLVNEVKRMFPKVKIVVGGAHISAIREKLLQDCHGVDYGIIWEGDRGIVELCRGKELDKISGLIYRENKNIEVTESGNFIKNLDELDFPKYETFDLNKYPLQQIAIVTSRGCPYDCIYCSVQTSIGKIFRFRSAESIVAEIAYWHNKGYREILILDDNFTFISKRVEEVCALLAEKNLKDVHLKLTSGIRADRVNFELLKRMRSVGFDYIAFGVEAATNKVLKNIKKDETIETIEMRIKEACELNFDLDLFFLIGAPGETLEDLKESFSLAHRYPVRRAIFYNLIPFPSTELTKWLIKNNYLTRPIEDILNNCSYYKNQPCFSTPEMSVEERKRAFKMGQKVYIEVRRKFLERKLNAPLFIKKIFSFIYARPVVENVIMNSSVILWLKERIKKMHLKQ